MEDPDYVSIEEAIRMVKEAKTVVAHTAFLAECDCSYIHIQKREMLRILDSMRGPENANVMCSNTGKGEVYIDNGDELLGPKSIRGLTKEKP
jgi:hypothetical protein